MIVFHGFLGLVAAGWCYALFKSLRAGRRKSFLLETSSNPPQLNELVSIVIPARNEQENIAQCISSAMSQTHETIEIVVLNDGSTDRTGEIILGLSENESKIIYLEGDGSPLPDGWFGKPWALQRAQKEAKGDWIAFIDADVQLSAQAIAQTVQYAKANRLDMITGIGRLEMKSFWEKVLQPAVGGFILAGNSLRKVNDPAQKDKNLANGQFILIHRKAYDKIGQHRCVQANILDDIGIARALVEHDLRYHCLDLQYMFSCRMYTSFSEIWEGWTKNLYAGLRYSIPNVVIAISFTFSFSVLGQVLLLLGALNAIPIIWLWWGVLITVLCQSVRLVFDIRRHQNILYGLSHAPANFIVCLIVINSMLKSLRGTVRWKGRTYKPS